MSMENTEKKFGALTPDQLIYLNEEIAGMARAGLPLEEGLASIAREMSRGNLKEATQLLAQDLKQGKSLPEAIAAQQGRVPKFYSSLMNAGIRGGNLPEVLALLTTYARSLSDLSSVVFTALLYPMMVILIAILLTVMIMIFVMPQFISIFSDFGMRLPFFTQLIVDVCRNPIPTLVIPLGVIGISAIGLRQVFNATEAGRCNWARLIYSLPVFGILIRSARLAAFADLLAILVENQMPLPEAFELAAQAGSDPILKAGGIQIAEKLRQGSSLAQALKESKILPEVVSWMAGMGELNGNLSQTLKQAAQMYSRQVAVRSQMVQSIFPPLLVVLCAGFITSIFVFAVFLPLINLLQGLSN